MNFDITRLTSIAHEDFNDRRCRVTNPRITARESIEIGKYIVDLQQQVAYYKSCALSGEIPTEWSKLNER